jgi:hypothetical protein
MKAPRYAAITIALDTEAYRAIRPDVRSNHAAYLLNRLFSGEEVADVELERLGLKVTIRPAVKPEIL